MADQVAGCEDGTSAAGDEDMLAPCASADYRPLLSIVTGPGRPSSYGR